MPTVALGVLVSIIVTVNGEVLRGDEEACMINFGLGLVRWEFLEYVVEDDMCTFEEFGA